MHRRKLILVLAVALLMLLAPSSSRIPWGKSLDRLTETPQLVQEAEQAIRSAFPFSSQLRNLYLRFRLFSGAKELNGIFLADNGLIQNLTVTASTASQRKNIRSLLSFAQSHPNTPSAILLIPTASAIYSNRLPSLFPIFINQKTYLESMYKTFSGNMSAVDVYPALFSERNRYLYYRTDPLLTMHGGFVVYQSLARRLGIRPKEEWEFTQQFLSHDYYGKLYDQWGFGGVQGDSITVYQYQTQRRAFQVKHTLANGEEKVYYTLYPTEAKITDGGLRSMILGGNSPQIEIQSLLSGTQRGSLLVVGDENCLSFLPFLALHYRSITYLSTSLLSQWEFERVDLDQYEQVLFSFSLDTFLNTDEPYIASCCGAALLP